MAGTPGTVQDYRREIERLRDILEDVQWYMPTYNGYPSCPSCQQAQSDGHAADCQVGLVVKARRFKVSKPLDVDRLLLIFHDLDHQRRQLNTTMEELRGEMKALRDEADIQRPRKGK